jgi:SNF2 family DNA or RNA helicase
LLPPRTDYVIFVNMGAEQAVAYKSVIDLLRVESAKSATPSAAALSLLQIMRRVCNHPSLLNESGSSDPKMSAAAQLSPAEICASSPKLALLNGILGKAAFSFSFNIETFCCRRCQRRPGEDSCRQQQH